MPVFLTGQAQDEQTGPHFPALFDRFTMANGVHADGFAPQIVAEWTDFLALDVAHDEAWPSSVALPVVPGVTVPTARPACHALRGQPCRPYEPFENVLAQ